MTEPTQPDREPAGQPDSAPAAGTPDGASGDAPPTPPSTPVEPAAPLAPDAAAVPIEPAGLGAPGATPGSAAPVVPETPDAAVVPVAPVEPIEPGAPGAPGAAGTGTGGTPPGRRPAAILGYVGAAILGIVIGAGALAIATGGIGGASPSPSPSPTPSAAPAGNTIGSPDAPVTIEVWADYQCPYCRLEDLLFGGALERQYVTPGIARIVYRDFAFLGQESTDAAVAARCAGAQEPAAQLRYHDALYTFQQGENQGRFARGNLLQIAEIAGVPDATAFEACLDDPAVAQAVADETTAGRNVGVTSTPTLRLRGPGGERVLTGFSQTWPPLRDAVEAVRVAPTGSPSPGGSPAPSAAGSPGPSPSTSPGETPSTSPSPANASDSPAP